MKKFYQHADGTPYAVEDVSQVAPQVEGRGTPRAPANEEAEQFAAPRRERLMRRGE